MTASTVPTALHSYLAKRDFAISPEPPAGEQLAPETDALIFVVQKHAARSLHYDFRLQWQGTLKSWAVPKGPSLDPAHKRMAVEVEDHPLAYAGFEGLIPPGQYGAGQVVVWDAGVWRPIGPVADGLRLGSLKFELQGRKLQGRWALVRMKTSGGSQRHWLLIKEKDEHARAGADVGVLDALPDRVLPARLPARLAPALATLAEHAPTDSGQWSFEIKFDGYRMLARVESEQVALFTRQGHDWSARLPRLVAELRALRLPNGWYDGEIVVEDERGLPSFADLQQAFERGRAQDVVFHLFDLPFFDGHDLRAAPLQARRARLQAVLAARPSEHVRFSQAFVVDGASVVASACKLGLEGVIGKRCGSPYPCGRSADWIKLKCGHRQEFVIGGYTRPRGTRQGFGALVLGVHEAGGGLRCVGQVGSGFSASVLKSLQARLASHARDSSPFQGEAGVPGRPQWVEPVLLAEVSFAGWTRAGRLRHAVFLGLRSDKPARSVVRETAVGLTPSRPEASAKPPAAPPPAGLKVTHAQRVIDPQSGVTKGALIAYYERVSALLMAHLEQRPLAWLRAPRGVGGASFFQKHVATSSMPGVRQLAPAMLQVVNPAGLLQAAQWNVLEFHSTNRRLDMPDRPDRMVFDLDPGDGVRWTAVQEAAELLHGFLARLGLQSFLKTSGGKGLHVVVPLRRVHGWDTVKDLSKAVVQHIAQTIPQRFVARSGPRNRVGKIFIDFLRNSADATTVAAWSARARPGLGISVPVAWEELPMLGGGDQWTVATADERLDAGNEPWAGYARAANSLTQALAALGGAAR